MHSPAAFILGLTLAAGLVGGGFVLGQSALSYREYERTVTVKGLSEREFPADIVIWPIRFTAADNDLAALYGSLEADAAAIREFLVARGIVAGAITASAPAVTDKLAQQYGGNERFEYRYVGVQTVTVYSDAVDTVRAVMVELVELGKQGIALVGENYETQPEYLFTRLNEVKPAMIEEATREARTVAEKFAD
ncbi:MAG: SIMPL domain-containing protein, partial [Gammaproteobacteria bacterium]